MTPEEYITKNYALMTDKMLAKNLDMDVNKVRRFRYKNGLKFCRKPYTGGNMYSIETNAKCYEMWIGGLTCSEIARQLNLGHVFVSAAISRFLPHIGPNKAVLVRSSKV